MRYGILWRAFLQTKKKISKKSIGDMFDHMSLATTKKYLHSLAESVTAISDALEGIFGGTLGGAFEPKGDLVAPRGGKEDAEKP